MDQLSPLLDITSKNLLEVQVNDRRETVDGKRLKVYSIIVKRNTLPIANINLRNCRNHHNAYFRLHLKGVIGDGLRSRRNNV